MRYRQTYSQNPPAAEIFYDCFNLSLDLHAISVLYFVPGLQ